MESLFSIRRAVSMDSSSDAFLVSLLISKDKRALALLLAASLTILSNSLVSPALSGTEASFPDQPHAVIVTRMLVTAPSWVVAIFSSL
jgi:hypothetical protein